MAGILTVLGLVLAGPLTGAAVAADWVGSDPSANFPTGDLPFDCVAKPTGKACIAAAVGYLNLARASLGQPSYTLPADFASLTPGEQMLILTDEDRIVYGLPPITGLTDAASQDAAGGIPIDNDPQPSNSDWYSYTANWSGGYPNIVIAYEELMYDDGPGGSNLDCTPSTPDGCWDHRHDILWNFDGTGPLEMGVATGVDPSNSPGYTQLIEQLNPTSPTPVYTYTWAQALADGASASDIYPPPAPPAPPAPTAPPAPAAEVAAPAFTIQDVRVHGHRVTIVINAPAGTDVRCSLHRAQHGTRLVRSASCSRPITFKRVPRGRYRLEVTSSATTTVRSVLVS